MDFYFSIDTFRIYKQLASADAKTHLTSKSYVVEAVIGFNLCSKRCLFIAMYRITDNMSRDRAKSYYYRRDKWYTLFGTALTLWKEIRADFKIDSARNLLRKYLNVK